MWSKSIPSSSSKSNLRLRVAESSVMLTDGVYGVELCVCVVALVAAVWGFFVAGAVDGESEKWELNWASAGVLLSAVARLLGHPNVIGSVWVNFVSRKLSVAC